MLDQAAQPAAVQLEQGKLTIQATNSSLRAILVDLERRTGMHVDGLSTDQRIFGVYGPGNPSEVLASLLDDSGYNVLIAGKLPDGTPRKIELSGKNSAAPQTAAQPTQAAQEAAEDDGDDSTAPQQDQPPPPTMTTPAPAAAGANPSPIRTPQEMLEELQKLRQQQQQTGTPQ